MEAGTMIETRLGSHCALIGGLALVAAASVGCTATVTPDEEPVASTAQALSVTLENGWTNAPYSTHNAGVYWDSGSGIFHFSGAVSSGTAATMFTLPYPSSYWPEVTTYVPVDLCGAANGRLIIGTDGSVSVQAESSFSDAQCFTSLDGATFAPSSAGFTELTLENGWTPYTSYTPPMFGLLGGAVRLRGAISSGTTGLAFSLWSGYCPSTDVYVPVDLCNATNGRLYIKPDCTVTVQSEGSFSDAQCFTSLDGAWFIPGTSGLTSLTLENGWTNAPYSTADAAVENLSGIVHFKGAISSGTAAAAFTLPSGFVPTKDVYVPVDLCSATKGRLYISSSTGVVSVQAEGGTFSNAQCFTSLEGASYSIDGF
jgi:hypothetical protein